MANKNVLIEAAQKHKEELLESFDSLKIAEKNIEDVQETLEEMMEHPRITSRIHICDYLYVDALLQTSEFSTKHGDHLVLSSYFQMNKYLGDYLQSKAIGNTLESYMNNIKLIDNSMVLANLTQSQNKIMDTEYGKLSYNNDGTVEIIEIGKSSDGKCSNRIARFKTSAEREEYLRHCK